MTWARCRWVGLGLCVTALMTAGGSIARGRLGPTAAELLSRAQADYQAGHYASAEANLARLARIRRPTPMDRMARALVAEARGRVGDALDELDGIPGDDPLAALAELRAGQIEVKRGRLRHAESHLLVALEKDPNLAPARSQLAYIDNVQLRLDEMDEQMDALSKLGSLEFDSLLHWSKTRNVAWNPAPDCQALAKSVANDADDRASRLALADGLRQLGRLDETDLVLAPLPDSDTEARVRRAQLALDRGQEERADRLLANGPEDHSGLAKLRGQLALRRRDPAKAIPHLRSALAAKPDDRTTLNALGLALRLAGDERAARACLVAVRHHDEVTPLIAYAATPKGKIDPKLPARVGAACEAAGRLAEASAWYRLAIARNPLDATAQQAIDRLSRDSSRGGF